MTPTRKLLISQSGVLLWLLMLCCLFGCQSSPPTSDGGEMETPNQANYTADGLLERFNTPAYVGPKDVANLPSESQQAFYDAWSDYVSAWTDNSIQVGLEPGNTNSLPGDYYFNPMKTAMDQPPLVVPVRWNAFPYRIRFYYQAQLNRNFYGDSIEINGKNYPKAPYELFKLADLGPDAYGKATTSFKFDQNVLPGKLLCSGEDKKFGTAPFDPLGPRGWLDEYCEFGVSRTSGGDIDWAMFTCENPEYYWTLWSISPESVRDIYRNTLGNQNITVKDLCLKGPDGDCLKLPNGQIAYNPINKWNNGPIIKPGVSGGAIHLTSPPNELSAEIVLAGGACIPRQASAEWGTDVANDLICCSQYGRPYRNSDPHIGQSVYQAISKNPIAATLLNPVGLYLQEPNFDLYEIPEHLREAGHSIEKCWKVIRGEVTNPYFPNNMILRAKFEVPDSWGIQTNEILVAGLPLMYASQISETMQIQLVAGSKGMDSIAPTQPCVEPNDVFAAVELVSYTSLYTSSVAAGLDTASNISSNPITTQVGTPMDSILIITSGMDYCQDKEKLIFSFFDGQSTNKTDMSFNVTNYYPDSTFSDKAAQFIEGTLTTPTGTPAGNKWILIYCGKESTVYTLPTPGYFRVAENN